MYCGHCGAQIADSSKFCPRCGQVMAAGGGAAGQVPHMTNAASGGAGS